MVIVGRTVLWMTAWVIIIVIVIDGPPSDREDAQHKMMKFLEKRHAHIQRPMMTLLGLWTGVHNHSFGRLQTVGDHDLLTTPAGALI